MYSVAKKAGCTSEALYKWRDRKTTPSLYLLECICYALNIQIVDLLYDDPLLVICDAADKELFQHINTLTNSEKAELMMYIQTHMGNKSDKKQA